MLAEVHRVLKPGGRLVIGFIDEVEQLLLETGFSIDAWGQTLARPLPETREIESLRAGRGQCAFVVVAATKEDW